MTQIQTAIPDYVVTNMIYHVPMHRHHNQFMIGPQHTQSIQLQFLYISGKFWNM